MKNLLSKHSEYPLLKNIFLFQIITIFAGLGIFYALFSFVLNTSNLNTIKTQKEKIRYLIETKHEDWIAMKIGGLDAELKEELENFASLHNLGFLKVIDYNDSPKKPNFTHILIPSPDSPNISEHIIWGQLTTKSTDLLKYENKTFLLLLTALAITFAYLVYFTTNYIQKKLYRPFLELNGAFKKLEAGEELNLKNISASGEIKKFATDFQKLYTDKCHSDRLAAISHVVSQVTHDIRSPLAALKTISQHIAELPEQKRIMIRSGVQRIEDIINDLQSQNSQDSLQKEDSTKEKLVTTLISGPIEVLISEKRLQFKDYPKLSIDFELDEQSYGLFVKITPKKFKRALSNIINNAIEATKHQGNINIKLSNINDHVLISILDDGMGIPQDILPNVFKKGVTHGKKTGSGLGLHFAEKTIKECQGDIAIESSLQKGTCVTLKLPQDKAPKWFLSSLKLTPQNTLVIIDDDESIHHIWNNQALHHNINIKEMVHLYSPNDLRSWHKKHHCPNCVYLCDYEFSQVQETGLNIISELGITKQAVLVTSRFEEAKILDHCLKHELRLLPKNLANLVPIENHSPS